MPSKSKQKGYRAEKGIEARWTAAGVKTRRVPLSGALGHILGDEFHGDLKCTLQGRNFTLQSKCLAKGWKTLYRHLLHHDCLIVKADFKEALVVIPESLFLSLVCREDDESGSTGLGICETAT